MAKQQRYSREFKLQASKLVVAEGYSYREAAARFETTDWSVRQWVKKFRESGDLPPKDQPVAEAEELKRLRKENKQLQLENKILKKATAYFAKDQL